jgi:hypothetical protein
VSDTTIAIAGAVVPFLIPIDARRGECVMNWQSVRGLLCLGRPVLWASGPGPSDNGRQLGPANASSSVIT